MRVKNLVSWSGGNFNYAPGDEISLPDDTAHARVAIGRASYLNEADAAKAPKQVKQAEPHPKFAAQKAADDARRAKNRTPPRPVAAADQGPNLAAENAALKRQSEAMQKQLDDMAAQLAALAAKQSGANGDAKK